MLGVIIGLVSAVTLFVFMPHDPQAVKKRKEELKKQED
jgi:hypothetical protein